MATHQLDSATSTPNLTPAPPDGGPPALALPACRGAEVPAAPPRIDESSLLQSEPAVTSSENYGEDEKCLNAFVRLHPMLSLLSTGHSVLKQLAELVPKMAVQDRPVELCTKAHDDLFLRPANVTIGERPCVCGDRCLASVIAKLRFGDATPKAFVCVEHLLPSQLEHFKAGKGLPRVPGKCLLCNRYTTTFLYMLARHDQQLQLTSELLQHQTFTNAACPPLGDDPVDEASSMPSHASEIGGESGYRASAMLFVDGGFANSQVARKERIGALMFRPFVRFCSTDYVYRNDADGLRIVQINIASKTVEDPFRALPVSPDQPPAA